MACAMWQVSYGEPSCVGEIEEDVESDVRSIELSKEYAKEILRLLKEGTIKYSIGKR